ncbi:hypothetical protein TWF569_008637 [Orbilia oligospora]|nr:hypothetical protein TWF103_011556 [Orbilia oligospora]KAF3138942.1 hypothetical protein TWF569_008637 [Orbilia oligospora]
MFVRMASAAFKTRTKFLGLPIVGALQRGLVSYLKDSYYCEKGLLQALESIFGLQRFLTSPSHACEIGCKVGVTVAVASDASPRIMTTYAKPSRVQESQGYSQVEPRNKILVVDAALSTSAAPWYFKAHSIADLGDFMDGGVWKNNPTEVALSEAEGLWPESKIDLVLSLGTGTQLQKGKDDARNKSSLSGIFGKGFLSRLYKSFMSSLDGENVWNDLWSRLSSEQRQVCFRLNTFFPESIPGLDDVSKLSEMRAVANQSSPAQYSSISELSQTILCTMFYAELERAPRYYDGAYECDLVIRCRWDHDKSIAKATLMQLQRRKYLFFVNDTRVLPLPHMASFNEFSIPLRVILPSLITDCYIRIGRNIGDAKDISGFPAHPQKLLQLQGQTSNFRRNAFPLPTRRLRSGAKRQRLS